MDTASAMSRVEVPKYPRWANSVDAASSMRPRVDDQSIGGGRQPSPYFTPPILSVDGALEFVVGGFEQLAHLSLQGFHVDVMARVEPPGPVPAITTAEPRDGGRTRRAVPSACFSPLALTEDDPVPVLLGGAGDVTHHVLDREVLLEGVVRHVLAESRCADAAVRHLADDRDVVVDPHATGVDLSRRALR